MNNTKTTKRALLSSVMAMLICVAMLIGTTFAWFTDSASTAVNKIQAGTLQIGLEMKDDSGNWVDAEGETLSWKKAAGAPAGERVLWEPGCTYELPELRIVNKGNLALKYKMIVSGITGDAKLLDVISFTYGDNININAEVSLAPNAKTEGIVIKGEMAKTAGNEYQGLSIDGIGITVVATQLNSEYDSNNNIYDTNATYLNKDASGNYLISNANELVFFAKAINTKIEPYYNTDKTFKLTADIDLGGRRWTPIGTKGTSNVFKGTFDGNGATISNLKISGGSYVALFGETSGATIKDLTVTGEVSGEDVAGIVAKATDTTIANCVSKVNVTATVGKAAGISASFGGTITKCENRGTVATAAAQPAGGLVAWCNAAVIENCHNYGAVTAGDRGALDSAQVGGLCGNLAAGSTIKNCSNSAVITSANFAGGVAGRAGAENKTAIVVEKFTNTGAIKGTYAAGIIADAKNVSIKESNVSGTITGSEIASGLFGRLRTGEITTSVVDATVTKSGENGYKGQYVGVIGGTVAMNLTGEARTDDIGCYADVTLTINGRIPNNNDFAGLNPQNFVHENQGHTKTIIIVAADGTSTTYTYSIANGYKWAK